MVPQFIAQISILAQNFDQLYQLATKVLIVLDTRQQGSGCQNGKMREKCSQRTSNPRTAGFLLHLPNFKEGSEKETRHTWVFRSGQLCAERFELVKEKEPAAIHDIPADQDLSGKRGFENGKLIFLLRAHANRNDRCFDNLRPKSHITIDIFGHNHANGSSRYIQHQSGWERNRARKWL